MGDPYAPISNHGDQLVETFYEGMEPAMSKVKKKKRLYTVVMGARLQCKGRKEIGWRQSWWGNME